MTANTNLLNIRLFRDFEEVMREPGYKEDLPVSTSNYQYLLGHYDLKDEVACCRQKESGILCKEGHKKGFVVKLVDDSVTVVGNTCATTKFGVDSKIQKHASMYASENDRQARIERLGNLLGNKSKIINELRDACTPVYLLKKKIEAFMDKLGRRNCTKLQGRKPHSKITLT